MKRVYLGLLTIILITFLSACDQNEDTDTETEEQVIPVETIHVTEGDLAIEKTLYGRIAPSSTTPVLIQTPGEIDKLEVENGDQVEEDELIAKLKTPAGIQEIKAPEAGEIMKLEVKEGDITSDTEPLAMIVDMDELIINFSVTSNVRALFEKEGTYQTMIDGDEYEIEITSIHSLPDDTGLYPIEATVENKDNNLLPGMIAMLSLPEKKVENTLLLPTEAIFEDSDGAYVYIVKDNLAEKRKINIIESQSDKTAFEGEVNEGDEVIINGQLTVSDGSKVDVIEEENQS